MQAYRDWIQFLLTDYYDPMYDYQLSQKTQPIRLRGGMETLVEYLQEHDNAASPLSLTGE